MLMKQTYEDKLAELALAESRIVVLTAENRMHIRSLPARLKERFVDVGICEQTLAAVAAGLALCGKIPVVHGIAAFLTMRAYEFIRTDIGLPNLNVKLVGSFPGFLSEGNGPTHQALEDLALMRLVPNMAVLAPSDEDDLLLAIESAIRHEGPVYIRYTNVACEGIIHESPFVIGKSETIVEGNDAAILVHSLLTQQAILASRTLAEEDIHVRVVNMRTLQPVDENAILRAAHETQVLLTLEDHVAVGGLFSITADVIARHRIDVALVPKGIKGSGFHPAPLREVIDHEGFSAPAIAREIIQALKKKDGMNLRGQSSSESSNEGMKLRRTVHGE